LKKKWLILSMLFFLSGCTATTLDQTETTSSSVPVYFNDSVSDFKEKYVLVVEKIEEMVSEMEGFNAGTSSLGQKTSLLKLSETDPDTIYYPEDFTDVYNNQTFVINSALSMDSIYVYKFLLEEIQSTCDFDNLILEETQIVDSEGFGSMSVTFYNALDGHILIHITNAGFDQFLKIGFDETGLFHLVFFQYVMFEEQVGALNVNRIDYNYEEFLEGDHLTLINSLEGDWIDYVFYDFPVGRQSSYSLNKGEEFIHFYDLSNKTTFSFQYIDGILESQGVGFDNEIGFAFGYQEGWYLPDGVVQISWQMLEVDGWDYVIVQNMAASNTQEGDGIFKDGQNLFVYGEDRLNIDLNQLFANIQLAKVYAKSELTDQILDLSAYGMTFSFEDISMELINQTLEAGLQMVEEKITYIDVYFRSDTVKQDVLTLLDPDIRSIIDFLSDAE